MMRRLITSSKSTKGQPALEVANTYDGTGAPGKQVQTTRSGLYTDDGFEVSTEVATTYYLRSSALGGKVVAELNTQGLHVTNHIYAGGMELAQHFPFLGSGAVNWLHTDPVTGSSFSTNTNRTFSNQKELDPLGADVTTPPPPMQPPSFFSPARNWAWAVEATWGPSEEYLRANAARASEMNDRWDMNMASLAAQHGNRAKYEEILHLNPNVGIMATGKSGSTTLWGAEAANFLTGTFILAGLMQDSSFKTDFAQNILQDIGALPKETNSATIALTGGDPLGGGDPQKAETTPQKDPCDDFLPLNIPSGVSVDANMKLAAEKRAAMLRSAPSPFGLAAARTALDLWFYNQVKDQGPWDYKYLTPDHKVYEPLGNFNYGATGAAAGYPLDTLYRVAGWIQQHGGDAGSGAGTTSPSLQRAYLGIGGSYPYGDSPIDSTYVKMGYDYARCRAKQQRQR
jgi:hypothetical protein